MVCFAVAGDRVFSGEARHLAPGIVDFGGKGQPRLATGVEGLEEVRQGRSNVIVIIGTALFLVGLLLYALDSPG